MASSLPSEKPGAAEPTPTAAAETVAQPQPAEGTRGAVGADEAAKVTGEGGGLEASSFPPLGAGKKKKRKKKRTLLDRGETALNKYRGTGFEEYYADPPMTPAEYHEEKHGIYDPNLPFHERIEECIQRFRARRRLDSERANYFSRYLMLGGIDATQRQFTGTRDVDFGAGDAGLDANDIRTMTANDVIQRGDTGTSKFYNPDFPKHWDVDFEGVAAGFLSRYASEGMGAEGKGTDPAIDTVLNFLNYVLQHDVCPEYEDDVNAARKVCEDAKVELPLCSQALAASPGAFNVAMRHLFCKGAKQFWDDDDTFSPVPEGVDADLIYAAAVAIQLPAEYTETIKDRRRAGRPIRVARTYEDSFEVVEVEPADEEKRHLFAGVKDKHGRTGNIGPVGWMVVRPCVIEDEWDNHPTLADGPPGGGGGDEAFLVDDELLAHLRAGMKLRLAVCELDVDLKFIKTFLAVHPSFTTFLPQSLMLLNWREPAPNERPAPSVDDPERDEREAAKQAMREVG